MEFTHFNHAKRAKMVDVTEKDDSYRVAVASGKIHMKSDTFNMIRDKKAKKGDVLAVAQIAGISAAKKTWDLIPMCHNLLISGVDMDFELYENDYSVKATATVTLTGKTGVEMEALTAVSVALLTVYDMIKAVDKTMTIGDIRLEEKMGGRTGHFRREE